MKLFKIILPVFIGFTFLTSCTEDIDAPVISDFELGANNSGIGYPGTEIHIESNVIADGKIKKIELEIHPESTSGNWSETLVYTEFEGLKNTEFHQHIEIPANTAIGFYHLHFKVVDLEGQSTEIERNIEIKVLVDNVMPIISVSNPANTNMQNFSNGQTISIAGTITDNIGISGLYIGLVKVSQGFTDDAVTHENTITLLHTHDFEEPDEVSFNASIVVGAVVDNDTPAKTATWTPGEYYLLVKAPNLGGGGAGYSAHFPITIN